MDVVFPFLVAAIDPVAEQQLVGLGNTVKSGRYLQTYRQRDHDRTATDIGSLHPRRSYKSLCWPPPTRSSTTPIK